MFAFNTGTIFEKADSDGNGTLTLDEALAACVALGNQAPTGAAFETEFKQFAAKRGGTEIAFEGVPICLLVILFHT
jgi:hypothetical protein